MCLRNICSPTVAEECDYLIVGAGDQGMAFVDALLSENKGASVVIVDPRDRPGGHWHEACPFARLHQPSVYYGCMSNPLDSSSKVGRPSIKGQPVDERWGRATTDQILAYFKQVMQGFLQTGRVKYFPMCTYDSASSRISHVLNKDSTWAISVKCKVVDTMYLVEGSRLSRPSPFAVSPNVRVLAAKDLQRVTAIAPCPKYVIIGSGRVGMDAVLWLLSNGVDPGMIQWVVPRDHWCFCREAVCPDNWVDTVNYFHMAIRMASSRELLVVDLERKGILCRIHDDDGAPCKHSGQNARVDADMAFHGTQVSREELASLRQVTDVIRLGHVRAISAGELELENGSVPQAPGTLYIDCTSTWMHESSDIVPIFRDRQITLQFVQQVYHGVGDFNICFHATLLGFLEGRYPDDTAWKNEACTPAKPVDTIVEWLESQLATAAITKTYHLRHDKRISSWMVGARPGLFAVMKPDKLRKLKCQTTEEIVQIEMHLSRLMNVQNVSRIKALVEQPYLLDLQARAH